MHRSFRVRFGGDGRLPPNRAFDQRVVAAAAANSLRSIEVVVAFDPDPGDLLGEIHKPVYGYHLAASDVKRMGDVAVHEGACTVEAVVNEHEATRLLAVAPNFDFVMAGQFRGDNFSADCCGGLFAAAIEGAVGTINIMVAGHPCFETEVFAEVPAHPSLRAFPSHSRPLDRQDRRPLPQAWNIGTLLFEAGIDACR